MFDQQSDRAALVDLTANLGAITAASLAQHLDISLGSARARLASAQRAGLLSRSHPLAGKLTLYTVTRAGLRSIDARGIEPCRVSAGNARHLAACAGAAAVLSRSYPDHRVQGERELRRDEREHGGPLASARLGAGYGQQQQLHRPDLVLWPRQQGETLPVAIEVELTVKSPRRLTAICRAWGRCREVDGVIYLITPEVERPLARAIEHAGAGERIVVLPLQVLRSEPID